MLEWLNTFKPLNRQAEPVVSAAEGFNPPTLSSPGVAENEGWNAWNGPLDTALRAYSGNRKKPSALSSAQRVAKG